MIRGGRPEIPRSLAGRPPVPQQVAEQTPGGIAYGLGWLTGFILFGVVRTVCEVHAAVEAWWKR